MGRLYFLRKLRSFNVCSKMLEIFYQSAMASAIYFALVCWGSSISAKDASRTNKLIGKAGTVIGLKLETFESVMSKRSLNKLLSIMDNPSHPLHKILQGQQSSFSNRLIQLRCHKERFKKSFLSFTIRLLNSSPLGNGWNSLHIHYSVCTYPFGFSIDLHNKKNKKQFHNHFILWIYIYSYYFNTMYTYLAYPLFYFVVNNITYVYCLLLHRENFPLRYY